MIHEGTNPAEFLVSEANGDRARDVGTLAYSSQHPAGTVLGQASTGKYKAHDPAATDGSQEASAILYANVDASNGDVDATLITRDSVVVKRALTFKDGITEANKTAALSSLEAKGIVAR